MLPSKHPSSTSSSSTDLEDLSDSSSSDDELAIRAKHKRHLREATEDSNLDRLIENYYLEYQEMNTGILERYLNGRRVVERKPSIHDLNFIQVIIMRIWQFISRKFK